MKTRKLAIVAMVAAMAMPLAANAGGGHGGGHHGGGHHGGDKDFCDPGKITTDTGLTLSELFALFLEWYNDNHA
ncbi:hypothetical protein [uncultured Thalassolituus sp.]|uniref:hypothetical protein n=1 Tax=uncultured Thalassolituus sp. TaxID=285273 RepID=UPI0026217724|nr:hypothetical protein [uncultured Thalassolituus sp.]